MSSSSSRVAPGQATSSTRAQSASWLARYWFWLLSGALFVYVALPWLAPLFMQAGWRTAAEGIYLLYATQCHQLPQRSFFLFGNQLMVGLADIQAAWQQTNDPLLLRGFTGNSVMGWKVAWSDRMVFMYTSLLLWGFVWRPLRRWWRPLPWWGLLLLLLPMILDGVTHMVSDYTGGLGAGFRETNLWLANLTSHAFDSSFYAGDGLGSFNSWMRLLSGVLFGLAGVWFVFPRIERSALHE